MMSSSQSSSSKCPGSEQPPGECPAEVTGLASQNRLRGLGPERGDEVAAGGEHGATPKEETATEARVRAAVERGAAESSW